MIIPSTTTIATVHHTKRSRKPGRNLKTKILIKQILKKC